MQPNTKTHITKEVLEQLIAEGCSQIEMMKRLGCAQSTIRDYLRGYGIVMRPKAPPIPVTTGKNPCGWHLCKNTTDKKYCSASCKNKAAVTRKRAFTVQACIAYKGGECQACGYKRYSGALVFHHLDPSKKSFSLRSSGNTFAWATLQAELDKCVLLCGNCHAEAHAGLLDLTQALSRSPTPEEGMQMVLATGVSVAPGRKSLQGPKVCPDCGVPLTWKGAVRCRHCAGLHRPSKIVWPSCEEILHMLETSNMVAVGRVLEVSDNAVRKHLRKQGSGGPDRT